MPWFGAAGVRALPGCALARPRIVTNRCESRCAIQRQENTATSPLAEQWLLRQLQNPFPLACLGRAHTPGAPHCRGSARPESAPYRVLQLPLFPFVQPRRGVFVCGFRPHSWLGGRRQARRAEAETLRRARRSLKPGGKATVQIAPARFAARPRFVVARQRNHSATA